jgi:hypothetical protein
VAGCTYAANCDRVQQRCRDEAPALLPLDNTGHLCRCWFPVTPGSAPGAGQQPLSAATEQGAS